MMISKGEGGAGQGAQQGGLLDAQHEQVLPKGGAMSCVPRAGELGRVRGRWLTPGL